jgi:RNA polymerase-binding transcription factor DksA
MDKEMTKEEKKELEKLLEEITEEAKNVIDDYTENPSDMKDTVTQVHTDSNILKTREERMMTSEKIKKILDKKKKRS